ncbi:MAG: hypothetical protein M5U28_36090 [Sandaracinaceae bacterium]|nr:hypothetical protein [Sandaracinaceae bacterium]
MSETTTTTSTEREPREALYVRLPASLSIELRHRAVIERCSLAAIVERAIRRDLALADHEDAR